MDWSVIPDAKTKPGGNQVLPFCVFCEREEGQQVPASFVVHGVKESLALCFRHLRQIQTALGEGAK